MTSDGYKVTINEDGSVSATVSYKSPVEKARETVAALQMYHDREAYVALEGDPAVWDAWHAERLAYQVAYTKWWDGFSEAEKNTIEDEIQQEYYLLCTEIDDDESRDGVWDWAEWQAEKRVERRHGLDLAEPAPSPPMPEKHKRRFIDIVTSATDFLKTMTVVPFKR